MRIAKRLYSPQLYGTTKEAHVVEGEKASPAEAGPVFDEFRFGRFFASLFSTTRDVLFWPRLFFDWLSPNGPLKAPVLYFLVCCLAAAPLSLIITGPLIGSALLAVVDSSSETPVVAVVLLVFLTVYVPTIVLFFGGVALQHLIILLVARREQHGFGATLRVSCYSVGALALGAWVPLAGAFIIPYGFYVYTTGLKRIHRISNGRALAAVLIFTALSLTLWAVMIFAD